MNELGAELPAAGMVRVVGPEEAGAGFLVSAGGLIVTCAHVLAGCAPGAIITIEPHVDPRPLRATIDLLQDPPDVAVMRLTAPVPPEVQALRLGRSPRSPQPGLRTFGYPQMRAEAGLPGELAFNGVTAADGYDQLALRSEEATLGFSGAPIWDPQLGVVVGMVKSIARGDPGQRLGTTAIGVPAEVIRDLCPELRLPAGCPYRGLDPFTEEHVDFYYGREHATSQLLTSLAARDFVPVVAVSGAGKSSLLQAGLAKGLQDRPVLGLAQRIRCYQRVSGQPHAGLLHSLAQRGILLPQELATASPQELATAIRDVLPPAELIIVVDQFERLYTDCEDAERKRFIALLRHLTTDTVKVVIGLRADFYHLALADLGERLAAGQIALAPMSEQDLGQAIAAPAEKLLRSFQPGLTQRLIADVRGRPGDLPLLQFALTELWKHDAAGGVLTEETYRNLGVDLPDGTRLPGAQGALIRRAEQLWQDLGPADQLRLQRILLGLIAAQPAETSAASLGVGTRDLSRPARLAQWDEDDQRLIQRLIDARLLTAGRAPAAGQPTVEVSHEALLRAWPRLRSWLEKRSQFVQWRAQDLAPNLERWLDSDKRHEFLLPRSLLDPALRWLSNYPDELGGPAADYIHASKRRRTRRRSLVSSAVAVLVAASLAAAGIFYSLQQTALAARDQAIASQVAVEADQLTVTDPSLAAQLDVAANQIYSTPDSETRLLDSTTTALSRQITGPMKFVDSVAFSPDGRTLAAGSADHKVWLWNLADPARPVRLGQPLTGPANWVASVAFSPDGRTLAAGSTDHKVWLWNLADPARPVRLGQPLTGPTDWVNSVAFSPDGRTLAAGSADDTLWLWNLADPARPVQLGQPLTGPTDAIDSVAFSPDGRTLAAGSQDNDVYLWNLTDPTRPTRLGQPLTGPTDWVNSVAFSPDGRTMAAGSQDNDVYLWNVTDPTHPIPLFALTGPTSFIGSVAFSPDGRTLAAASGDDKVWLWNVAEPARPVRPVRLGQPLTGNTRGILSVAFSPDGRTLVGGSEDSTVRLWNLPANVLTGPAISVDSVAFDPDRRIMAIGGGDDKVWLWSLADPTRPGPLGQPLTGPTDAVVSVAFSRDGRTLAAGSVDGKVWLWNLADPDRPAPLGQLLTGPRNFVDSVAFSPDGRTLAAGTANHQVWLWNMTDPTHPTPLGQLTETSFVESVAFSPDGRTLAAGSTDHKVWLWNLADPARPVRLGQPLTGPSDVVKSVAFSPDGRTLAAGSQDKKVWLWNMTDLTRPTRLGQPLTGPSDFVESVAFSPDGRTLAAGSQDKKVWLWNMIDPTHPTPLGQPLTGPTDFVESAAFSPDGQTVAAGSADHTVQLWNLDVDHAIQRICATTDNLTPALWKQYISQLPYDPPCTHQVRYGFLAH